MPYFHISGSSFTLIVRALRLRTSTPTMHLDPKQATRLAGQISRKISLGSPHLVSNPADDSSVLREKSESRNKMYFFQIYKQKYQELFAVIFINVLNLRLWLKVRTD